MKKMLKKSVALLLSLVLVTSAVALAASAAATTNVPTVYLGGYGTELHEDRTTNKSKKIYPASIPDDFASTVLEEVREPFARGAFLNQWDPFHQLVIDKVTELYGPIALDHDGNVFNGSGNQGFQHTYPLSKRYPPKSYSLSTYQFSYDWRLDPFEVADMVAEYIEEVCKATGFDKVNLLGRCLGANIILAYLKNYGYEHVNKVCFYAPGFQGFECVGALFSGQIKFDADAITDYLNKVGRAEGIIGDDPTIDLAMALLEYLNAAKTLDVLGLVFDSYLIPEFKAYILPDVLRNTFATFPSFWSFVGDEYYDKAMKLVFGGQEEEWAGLIEKANRYHNEVMPYTQQIIEGALESGADVYIVAKYGVRMVPVMTDPEMMSDSTVGTKNSSHGATTSKLYSTFSDDFVRGVKVANDGKYLSPDLQIDASTCLLPDHTWFIKNCVHQMNPPKAEELIAFLLNAEEYVTVFDYEQYPQYMIYDTETGDVYPMTQENAPAVQAPSYRFFATLRRLLQLAFEMLKNRL